MERTGIWNHYELIVRNYLYSKGRVTDDQVTVSFDQTGQDLGREMQNAYDKGVEDGKNKKS